MKMRICIIVGICILILIIGLAGMAIPTTTLLESTNHCYSRSPQQIDTTEWLGYERFLELIVWCALSIFKGCFDTKAVFSYMPIFPCKALLMRRKQ